jgi:hypothetical protein
MSVLRNLRAPYTALVFSLVAACSGNQPTGSASPSTPNLLNGQSFVAIERDGAPTALEAREALKGIGVIQSALISPDGPQNFYLAVRRADLDKRWFLTAYVRDIFPGAVNGGAASELDLRVVTFRQQNDKLFMIDADGRKQTSDLFDPDILIDAFPIITDYAPFQAMPGASDYVLIDPATGLNQFSLIGDLFTTGAGARLNVDLNFLQRFRNIADGITYEHVFSGYDDQADKTATTFQENPFRVSGTLGVALRQYREDSHYTPTKLPDVPHYFTSAPKAVLNTGTTTSNPIKWPVYPGMKPIDWVISREVLKLQADPRYQQYDLVGALKTGIESWNTVFGYQVLRARIANPDEDMDQDDKNVFIVDLDPTADFAFANSRSNPVTGEIRGASVYMSATFLVSADQFLKDDPGAGTSSETTAQQVQRAQSPRPPVAGVAWGALAPHPLCNLRASDVVDPSRQAAVTATKLTKKEKVERSLMWVATHEVGHTLGLRHNFKGSLLPPTSSVMDYLIDNDQIAQVGPGNYDSDAIKYLYGMNSQLPKQPFCTDEDTLHDPLCVRFDSGADPLGDYHIPLFNRIWNRVLAGTFDDAATEDLITNPVLGFVRAAATSAARLQAWKLVNQIAGAPLAPEVLKANRAYGPFADRLEHFLLARLLQDTPDKRGDITQDPPATDADLVATMTDQMRLILINADGIRSYESRRLMVDLLKQQQSVPALAALESARADIAVQAASATGSDLILVSDLLVRIDAATLPYFR